MKKNNAYPRRKGSDKPMTLADRPNKFITETAIKTPANSNEPQVFYCLLSSKKGKAFFIFLAFYI